MSQARQLNKTAKPSFLLFLTLLKSTASNPGNRQRANGLAFAMQPASF
jgi:hypothetical protein